MEKGTVGVIAAGLVAVWAFFSLTGTQDAHTKTTTAKIDRDRAEFNRDFSRAWGDPQQQQDDMADRAKHANDELEKAKLAEVRREATEQAKRDHMESRVEDDMHQQSGGSVDMKSAIDNLGKVKAK